MDFFEEIYIETCKINWKERTGKKELRIRNYRSKNKQLSEWIQKFMEGIHDWQSSSNSLHIIFYFQLLPKIPSFLSLILIIIPFPVACSLWLYPVWWNLSWFVIKSMHFRPFKWHQSERNLTNKAQNSPYYLSFTFVINGKTAY